MAGSYTQNHGSQQQLTKCTCMHTAFTHSSSHEQPIRVVQPKA